MDSILSALDNPKENKLEKGIYKIQLLEVKAGIRQFYNKPDKTITFLFFVLDENTYISRTVSAKKHKLSKLVEIVSSMQVVKKDILTISNQDFSKLIHKQIGKIFLASLEPTKNGQFTNLVKIIKPVSE